MAIKLVLLADFIETAAPRAPLAEIFGWLPGSVQVFSPAEAKNPSAFPDVVLSIAELPPKEVLERIERFRAVDPLTPLFVIRKQSDARFDEDWLSAGAGYCLEPAELLNSPVWKALARRDECRTSTFDTATTLLPFVQSLVKHFPSGWLSFLNGHRVLLTYGGQLPESAQPYFEYEVGRPLSTPQDNVPLTSTLDLLFTDALNGTSRTEELELGDVILRLQTFPAAVPPHPGTGIVLLVEDVTRFRRAELDLLHTLGRFSSIVNSAMDAIISIDESQQVVLFNPAAERMFGYTADEIVGQPLDTLIPAKFRPSHRHHVVNFGQTGQTQRRMGALGTVSGQRSGGEQFPIEASISQVTTGGQTLFTVILRDITERQKAEAELSRSRSELEAAKLGLEERVKERTHALELANRDLRASESRLLYANRAFARLANYRVKAASELQEFLEIITREGSQLLNTQHCGVWTYDQQHSQLIPMAVFDRALGRLITPNPITAATQPALFDHSLNGPTVLRREVLLAEGKKQHLTALVNRLVISGEEAGLLICEDTDSDRVWRAEEETFAGKLSTFCALGFESHQRHNAEAAQSRAMQEAEAARDEAQTANAAKSEFLSRMSHELRTPLNSILGFAQIMEMSAREAKQASRVNHILGAGRHLLRLVDEVLDIARVESGHLSLSPEPVNVVVTVEKTLDLVRPLFQEKALYVAFENESHGELYARADQQRVSQVLLNLFSNAAKYNYQSGKILVAAKCTSTEVRISVTDSGPGIPADKLEKLFQPFERLGAESGPVQGTGLGLALSRRLVEAMGGRIGVETLAGQGSTFWVTLPRCEPTHLSSLLEDSDFAPAAKLTGGYSVLYIEDNSENLQVIREILEDATDFHLISAMQGHLGLDLARQHRPALILLDLHLPDMHGKEVLTRLRANPETRDIPVLVITADVTPKLARELKLIGADEYLSKPLDVRKFLDITRQLLPPVN